MNNCSFVGRITTAPEVKDNGTSKLLKFSIAVKRNKEKTDFINCVAWNKSAEYLQNYCKKGDMLSVAGRLEQSTYTDNDNNKKTSYEICANTVQIIPTGKKEYTEPKVEISFDGTPFSGDDDLPFTPDGGRTYII